MTPQRSRRGARSRLQHLVAALQHIITALRHLVTSLRDFGEDIAVTVGRSLSRVLVLGAGAAVACGVLTFSIVESSTQATRVASSFDVLAATRLQVDLPLAAGTYRTLAPEHVRAIAQEPGVVGLAWLYRDQARLTSVLEPHWQVDERLEVFTVGGDSTVLGVGRGPAEASLPGEGLWLGGAVEVAGQVPRHALLEVNGTPSVVAGVTRRSDLIPEMLHGVVRTTPQDFVDLTRRGVLIIQVRLGWADAVARRLQTQLEPVSPDRVVVRYPPEAQHLRSEVVTRVDTLVVVTVAALLLISAVTVGLATFARVLERRRLIGLLRAIGASRRGIALGMAGEAAVVGALAGGAGALIGLVIATLRASRDGGGVVVPWSLILGGLALALAVNGLGALVPAWMATRVSPIRAIRDL